MKQLLVLGLGILMVCLSACSDDDPKEPQNAPRSLITEFVRPGSLFHEESAFNVQFVLNEETSKIDGVKVLDFDITAPGYSIDFSTDPVFFVQQLTEIGDLNAPENLPSDCELYRPAFLPNIFSVTTLCRYRTPRIARASLASPMCRTMTS